MKRILVGLDASERAHSVLRYASELAQRTGGKLVLFRAVGIPIDLPAQAFAMTPSELTPMLLKQAANSLRQLASGLPEGMVESVETDIGMAWQTLCDAAKRLKADLVVIGSHGYGTLDRLLGTTAARVVNHAECSVLVVRNPDEHPL